MRIRYDADADVLLLTLRRDPPADAVEDPAGVVVSYGEDGEPVSIELLHASARKIVQPGELSVTLEAEPLVAVA